MVRSNRKIKNIKKIRRIFSKYTVIVVRYSNGRLVNSRPCMHCAEVLKSVGIKQVIYSDSDGGLVKEKMSRFTTTHVSRFNR